MKVKVLNFLILATTTLLVFSSCGKDEDEDIFVPASNLRNSEYQKLVADASQFLSTGKVTADFFYKLSVTDGSTTSLTVTGRQERDASAKKYLAIAYLNNDIFRYIYQEDKTQYKYALENNIPVREKSNINSISHIEIYDDVYDLGALNVVTQWGVNGQRLEGGFLLLNANNVIVATLDISISFDKSKHFKNVKVTAVAGEGADSNVEESRETTFVYGKANPKFPSGHSSRDF